VKLRTWHVEAAVVWLALHIIGTIGGTLESWTGYLQTSAVWVTFLYIQVVDRMSERQGEQGTPAVPCFRMATVYHVVKDSLWLIFFLSVGMYPAALGGVLFLSYPAWRKWWRRKYPIAA
jgi:hypothetical protein